MEGAAAALCTKINKTPFLLLRTISDNADGKATKGFSKFLKTANKRNTLVIEDIIKSIYV